MKSEMNLINENKMGTKSVFPLLMSMAFPAMLSMFIQSMYNVVDSMFVAQISNDALTAVSLAFPIQNLILSVAVGTGIGINSLISRRLGAKEYDKANSAVTHGLILAGITSVVFIIFGMLFTKPFFGLFTNSESILSLGCDYTYIVTVLSFGTIIHIAIEKILQGTGMMVYPMIFQAVGAIINIVLDPILIFGWLGFPALGVKGAAIATIVGQIVAMTLAVGTLLFMKNEVKVKIKEFKLDIKVVKDIYAVGFPSTLMYALGSILVMGLNVMLIRFSEAAVALFGVYFKLQSFVFMPVNGLIQGAMPIMGYNYGAKNKKRLIDTLKASLMVATLIMGIGSLIFILFPTQLLLLFNASEEMLSIGKIALRIISLSYISAAICFMFSTLFQGINKGAYSLLISILRQIAIILPLSFILSKTNGLVGIWVTFPIAETVSAIISILLFRHVYKTNPIFKNT